MYQTIELHKGITVYVCAQCCVLQSDPEKRNTKSHHHRRDSKTPSLILRYPIFVAIYFVSIHACVYASANASE